MELKDKIKELRIKNNMLQKDLAEKCFVTRSAVAKWENGLGMPSEVAIEKLCEIFGVERSVLIENQNNEESHIRKNKSIKSLKIIVIVLASLLVITLSLIPAIVDIKVDKGIKPADVPESSLNGNGCTLSYNNITYINYYHKANLKYLSNKKDMINKINTINKSDEYVFETNFFKKISICYYFIDSSYDFYEIKDEKYKNNDVPNYVDNTNYYREVEVNNNRFSIPMNDFNNLIEVMIWTGGDNYFIYYFLAA